jgi:uncharacterized protein YjbI with pentapeptide repeats
MIMDNLTLFLDNLAAYKDGATAFRDISLAFAGIGSVFFLAVRVWAMSISANAAQRQASNVQEGSFNEQYIQSLSLLSSEKVSARIGGIYGLGAVAETSNRFRSQSLRVLTISLISRCSQLKITKHRSVRRELRIEIQSILNTIGRIKRDINLPEIYDFSNLDLSGFNFRGDFSNSIFKNTSLIKCSFNRVNLSHSRFEVANLANAKLSESTFKECKLHDSMFNGTEFTYTDFSNSIFSECIFEKIRIVNSKVNNSILLKCDYDKISLEAFDSCRADNTSAYETAQHGLSKLLNFANKKVRAFMGKSVSKIRAANENLGINGLKESLTLSEMPSHSMTSHIKDSETSYLTVYSDSDAVVQTGDVDPILEAEVYLAYGRKEQAVEVLTDGMESNPDRIDILQMLLRLYEELGHNEKFEQIVKKLSHRRSELSYHGWKEVIVMVEKVLGSNYSLEHEATDNDLSSSNTEPT